MVDSVASDLFLACLADHFVCVKLSGVLCFSGFKVSLLLICAFMLLRK